MRIGIPTQLSLLSTDVADTTDLWSQSVQKTWYAEDKVRWEGSIYVAAQNITVTDFSPVRIDYKTGDVIWCSSIDMYHSKNMVVKAMEGEIPKPPSLYENVDTSADHTTWTERFMMIRFKPYTFEFNDLQYTFTPNGDNVHVEIVSLPPNSAINKSFDLPRVTLLTSLHTVQDAELANNPDTGADYWTPRFVFEDDTGLYVRTNVDYTTAPREYHYTEEVPIFTDTVKPSDIPAFYFLGATNDMKPFDMKNYSKAARNTSMTYTIRADEPCNMFVLGYVMGDTFDYTIKDAGGSVIASDSGVVIDGRRDIAGLISDWYTTIPIYSPSTIPTNGTVEVTIHGSTVELGSFLVCMYGDMGFTNLTLQNTSKDFSVFEYDAWGNAEYLERARVSVYNGTVDVPIEKYDIVDRFFTSLGRKIVVMDGSDNAANATPDSVNIFAATQKIGRVMNFKQNTKIKYNDIDTMANYSFTLEEIVSFLAVISVSVLGYLGNGGVM